MPYLKLKLRSKHVPALYSITNPTQNKLVQEVLSFDGGYAFASSDELIVKKPDGTTFMSPLSFYESDFLTETYVGHFKNGQPFRFLFASNSNPMAQIEPMVTFAGMATDGWAVHYYVCQ